MEKLRVKPGRIAARPSPSRLSMRTQNEWNVAICGGRSRFISSSSEATRERISPAALFVNVTARTADAGTCFALIRCEMRCVMTRVLPLPAPARIRTGPSVVSTASRCWGLRPERKSTNDLFSHWRDLHWKINPAMGYTKLASLNELPEGALLEIVQGNDLYALCNVAGEV